MTIIGLIHDITQLDYKVSFSDDFQGMVSVTFYKSSDPSTKGGYIRHEHLSYPGGSMKELEASVINCLNDFYLEAKNGGTPKKDGLAD